jgi:hypothetical protein
MAALEAGLLRSGWLMEAVDEVVLSWEDLLRLDMPAMASDLKRLERRRLELEYTVRAVGATGRLRQIQWWEPRLRDRSTAFNEQDELVDDALKDYDQRLATARQAFHLLLTKQAKYHMGASAAMAQALAELKSLLASSNPALPSQSHVPGLTFLPGPAPNYPSHQR